MRDLLALFLACFAMAASAVTVDPCTGQATSAPVWMPPDLTKDVVCERATGADYGSNSAGAALWQYCWDAAKGKFYPQTGVATWAYIRDNPGLVLDVLQAGPKADAATIKRILLKYDSPGSFIDPESAAIWCPLRPKILAGIPPAPVVAAWVTSGMTTYRFTGTGLGGVAGTTPLGQPCDCAKPYMLGSATYCPLQGGPGNTVARCKRP